MSSIVIADSHVLCREALCDYIRHADKSYAVHSLGDFSALRLYFETSSPDLVLINEDLPGFDVQNLDSGAIGLMVSWMEEKYLSYPSYHGIFPKTLTSKDFLFGIQEILAGRTFFPSIAPANYMTSHFSSHFKPTYDFGLTAREKEVLEYLVRGQANKEIARALKLQVVTVKLHVRGICRKLKAANRTQAAIIAKENGWG